MAPNCSCRTTYLPNVVSYSQNCEPLPTLGVWTICSELLELWKGLLKLEVRGIEQDLIPYVRQLELPTVPVEEWAIHPDLHGHLDGPCDVVQLPAHIGEFFHPDMMTCDVGMVIDGGRSPEMFHQPFPSGPCRFLYVLLLALQPITLIPIYYSTLLSDVIFVLRGLLMVLPPLK